MTVAGDPSVMFFAAAADPKNARARRRFGKGFRVALRPL